jgi:hypothetical protein
MADLIVEKLQQHVSAGLVKRQDHTTLPLSIYNYTPRVQYEKLWDEITIQTRGLVLCGEQVVARPFGKFFNDTEHEPEQIPWHLPYEVTEKLDGSLLILFCFNGQWLTATRGSFVSEQAIEGAAILRRQCANHAFDPAVTYLFEVIYPANRIVVDYGGRREIVLIAMIETATGNELSLDNAGLLKTVRRLPPDASAADLRSIIRDDEEGYVVRFKNGFRMKVKGERYMQLHRIVTGVSSRTIWESLSQNQSLDSVLDVAPDECADWIRGEATRQKAAFADLKSIASNAYLEVVGMPDRKTQALHLIANHRDLSSAVFALLDGKSCDGVLWKKLYPEFRRPSMADRLDA